MPITPVARQPGSIAAVGAGSAPTIDVATVATEEQAKAIGREGHGGGCEATVATQRHAFDPAKRKFVSAGKPRVSVAKNLCTCPKKK